MPRLILYILAAFFTATAAFAEPAADAPSAVAAASATDPNYRLSAGDTVAIAIYDEPELAATQTIARTGEVRLPLIGEIILTGKSVRDAERLIEENYRKREFLKAPVVNLVVSTYFPREVSVLGAVRSPGTVLFPRDVTSLDIVDVITRVGGFVPVSKSDAVTLTRRAADGKETVTTVNMENAIGGRRKAGRDRADILVYPGDRIWVPERLF
ncbi:MAG: polysaccharide biosynthesis/export family protein [Opitutaceae bacterium]|nr:polysaccharide biosynthesis/export family protein [Opitutaceae bacterium]